MALFLNSYPRLMRPLLLPLSFLSKERGIKDPVLRDCFLLTRPSGHLGPILDLVPVYDLGTKLNLEPSLPCSSPPFIFDQEGKNRRLGFRGVPCVWWKIGLCGIRGRVLIVPVMTGFLGMLG